MQGRSHVSLEEALSSAPLRWGILSDTGTGAGTGGANVTGPRTADGGAASATVLAAAAATATATATASTKTKGPRRSLPIPHQEFVWVQDTLDTPGAFVLHHLISLCHGRRTPGGLSKAAMTQNAARVRVCVVGSAESEEHYSAVARKLGASMAAKGAGENAKCRSLFIDTSFSCYPSGDTVITANETPQSLFRRKPFFFNEAETSEQQMEKLYNAMVDFAEDHERGSGSNGSASQFKSPLTLFIIDDVNMLIDAPSSDCCPDARRKAVVSFLQYCKELVAEEGGLAAACSVVVLTHKDCETEKAEVGKSLAAELGHLCTSHIDISPLETGHARDVHGVMQFSRHHFCRPVAPAYLSDSLSGLLNTTPILHYKVGESNTKVFRVGSSR